MDSWRRRSPLELLEIFLLGVFLLVLFGLAAGEVHSFDIFWQLQSGKYLVQNQGFIFKDLFSLAADAPRFEHCWLHDLICYKIYSWFGYAGISLLKGGLVMATGALLGLTARLRGSSWLAILLLLPPALMVTKGGWLERPQLWTFLFFSLFLVVLEGVRPRKGRVARWLIPAMLVWVNLHAGAILAIPLVAAYLAGEGGEWLLRRSPLAGCDFRWLGWTLLGVLTATLATPYGSLLLKTLLGAPFVGGADWSSEVTDLFRYNLDWRGTSFATEPAFFYALCVIAILLLAGWRRLRLTDLFLLGGLTLMGLKLGRHTTFLLLGAAAILPVYADAAVEPLVRAVRPNARRWLCALTIVAMLCSTAYFVYPTYQKTGFFRLGLRAWHYPVEAAEFVSTHHLPGNLYNTYDWGGYLMWTLYPSYLVFWDGRQDSPEMFKEGWQVMAGKEDWQLILDRHQVNTIVTRTCTMDTGQRFPLLDRLRESAAWVLVFADESSLVFVRKNAVAKEWLEQFRLSDRRIDDTILSEAMLLTQMDPSRYRGWWEQARIYLARRQYSAAYAALGQYLRRSPVPDPMAENYYRILYPLLSKEVQ